jgi:hypothetical protein
MNASSAFCHEEDLGYECPGDRQSELLSERIVIAASRKATAQERFTRQSRYSRRPAPQRMSGTHRRGNKRYGI